MEAWVVVLAGLAVDYLLVAFLWRHRKEIIGYCRDWFHAMLGKENDR